MRYNRFYYNLGVEHPDPVTRITARFISADSSWYPSPDTQTHLHLQKEVTMLDRLATIAKGRKTITQRARDAAEALYARERERLTDAWERSLYPVLLEAIAEGHSRAEIGRAYGSSDYATLRRLIARAEEWDAQGRPDAVATAIDTAMPATEQGAPVGAIPAETSQGGGVRPLEPYETPNPQGYEEPRKIEFAYNSEGEPMATFRGVTYPLRKAPGELEVYIHARHPGEDTQTMAKRRDALKADHPGAFEAMTHWDGTVGSVTV